nr:arrestin homolog [Procambarus clarkii]
MTEAIKVFKKSSPNGKITAYLCRRDFVDNLTRVSPVEGAVVVDGDYLRDRKVFARVSLTYRYGREEDEVMGLNFSKEYELVKLEVTPPGGTEAWPAGGTMARLLEKLGEAAARPFTLLLPKDTPPSVTLEPGAEGTSKKLGVIYELMLYVAENAEDQPHRRNSVTLAVRKIQRAPDKPSGRQPQILVSKGFTLHPGKLRLEVYLDRDLYYHGQSLEPHVSILNASKKTVKYILHQVVQHVEITMTNTNFSRIVASIESRDGCPIIPNSSFSRTIALTPLACRAFGVALDGQIQDKDATLASSTIMSASRSASDALGIIVSYSLRVRLNCGALGGELVAEIPFKLMHPDPYSSQEAYKSVDSLEFEEFSVLRRGRSISDELED